MGVINPSGPRQMANLGRFRPIRQPYTSPRKSSTSVESCSTTYMDCNISQKASAATAAPERDIWLSPNPWQPLEDHNPLRRYGSSAFTSVETLPFLPVSGDVYTVTQDTGSQPWKKQSLLDRQAFGVSGFHRYNYGDNLGLWLDNDKEFTQLRDGDWEVPSVEPAECQAKQNKSGKVCSKGMLENPPTTSHQPRLQEQIIAEEDSMHSCSEASLKKGSSASIVCGSRSATSSQDEVFLESMQQPLIGKASATSIISGSRSGTSNHDDMFFDSLQLQSYGKGSKTSVVSGSVSRTSDQDDPFFDVLSNHPEITSAENQQNHNMKQSTDIEKLKQDEEIPKQNKGKKLAKENVAFGQIEEDETPDLIYFSPREDAN